MAFSSSRLAKEILARLGRYKRYVLSGPQILLGDTKMIRFGRFRSTPEFTQFQRMFVEWNAERLQIPYDDCRERYLASWRALPKGHRGTDYREFNKLSHEVFKVFCGDDPREVYESYKFHARLHFLRFLSYDHTDIVGDEVLDKFIDKDSVAILDYGCGMAQASFSLVERLKNMGGSAKLILADIPTLMKDFLLWVGKRTSVSVEFIDCDTETPYPDFPPCDICIATEVFEHIHDPVRAFRNVDSALAPGGYLVANIDDHDKEFFHVSPYLASLRGEANERGYTKVSPTIFKKPD